jgi:hypothetical protein
VRAASSGRLRGRGHEAGVALLLAVWLLALLAVVVGEFVFSTRVRAAAERNKRDDLRAWTLAIAGYRAALAALDDEIAGLSLNADDGLLLHYKGETEGTPAAAKDVVLGDGTYSWRIVSEDGLVNVNAIQQRAMLVNLVKACGLGPGADRDTVIDSILDWRDQNREHRLNGAEEDYYRGLDPPYSCKDGDLDVLEELLLVRGVTPELFFGKLEQGKAVPGLRDLLSVHSLEANPNLATAPKAVLEALAKPRPARPTAPGSRYRIIATGNPGAGAPSRSLQAVVERIDDGGKRDFTLLYWNDTISPEPVGREGGI